MRAKAASCTVSTTRLDWSSPEKSAVTSAAASVLPSEETSSEFTAQRPGSRCSHCTFARTSGYPGALHSETSCPPTPGVVSTISTVTSGEGAAQSARADGAIQACHSVPTGAATVRSKVSVAKRPGHGRTSDWA